MKQATMIDAKPGEFHRVPCLCVPQTFHGELWIPVLGSKHQDKELGFEIDHYHIYWRFVTDRMFKACSFALDGGALGQTISNDTGVRHGPHKIIGTPQLHRRKCRRAMPNFPLRRTANFIAMEEAQRQRCNRLKDGHTCPHRGIDLRPFVQPDGTAICPGHGLRWDMRTGEMLARHALKACAKP